MVTLVVQNQRRVVIDEADVTASRAALRQQVERGGIRLARLLEQALG